MVHAKQERVFDTTYFEDGHDRFLRAEARFDDRYGNGHDTFSLTAAGCPGREYRESRVDVCGCCHDLIEEHFPSVAHLVKWHLCSTDGPLHYLANTLRHASDRDWETSTNIHA